MSIDAANTGAHANADPRPHAGANIDARARILLACARVIARRGLSRFRMQEVAREADVSIGLLAYHFGDRDGLLQAALDHVTEGAARRAQRSQRQQASQAATSAQRDAQQFSDTTPLVTDLVSLLAAEFGEQPAVRDGSVAWNEVRAAAVFAPAQAVAVARSTADWQAAVQRCITLAAPGWDSARSAEAALILTALVEGLSGRWLTGQLSVAGAQRAVETAVNALGCGSSAVKRAQ